MMSERQDWVIVVGCDMLEWLVDIQLQLERLAVKGDDEYRGFLYRRAAANTGRVGRCRGVDCLGEYDSREAFVNRKHECAENGKVRAQRMVTTMMIKSGAKMCSVRSFS